MPKGYHHLSRDQRCQISVLQARGDSNAQIARSLNVHPSTITRELKRNGALLGYDHHEADEKATQRQKDMGHKKISLETMSIVEEKLGLQWSPVQISGWLKRKAPEHTISHETIYQHIWKDKREGGKLYLELRHHGKKYNKRSKGMAGRGCIPNRVDIKERPSIVEEKSRLGDYEIDTIVGAGQSGVIVSVVDRCSKLMLLKKIDRRTADATEQALLQMLLPIRDHVLTITADNGKEFTNHQEIGKALGASVYFATPYHSWERGLNEHTNGLVRQYLPKACRFDHLSEADLKKIETLLNNRPRKVLNFETPIEVFNRLSQNRFESYFFESSA